MQRGNEEIIPALTTMISKVTLIWAEWKETLGSLMRSAMRMFAYWSYTVPIIASGMCSPWRSNCLITKGHNKRPKP